MNNFDQKITEIAVMTFTSRHRNGRHSNRPEKDLIFAPPHFLKGTKNKLPTLNFSSRFLPYPAFSTFAAYNFLCVEKFTHKKLLATPPAAKELKLTHKTKTRAKKFRLPASTSLTVVCLLTVLCSIDCFAQQSVDGNLYDRYKNHTEEYIIKQQSQLFPPTPTPNGLVESSSVTTAKKIVNNPPNQGSENTAQDIANQQSQQSNKTMGHSAPVYTPGMTKEEMIAENNRFIKQQMANQKGYSQPTTENNFAQQSPQEMQYQNFISDLNEASQMNYYLNQTEYYQSKKYLNDLSHFENVKNRLKDMLSGKQKLSIKDAYFAVESTYGNLYLTYEEYNNIINANVKFIKLWLTEKGLDINNPEALHYGIQQLMNDTLKLVHTKIDDPFSGKFTTTHIPYYYDYIDYTAEKDKRNYFVTKTLATGTGQCHTLPVTYLILAEALGVEAYLSY